MSRRSTPRPLPSLLNPDGARRLTDAAHAGIATLDALAGAARALAEAGQSISAELAGIAAAIRDAQQPASAVIPLPERIIVRGLGPQHLGRWISLESTNAGPDGLSVRPAGDSGRLVGMRPVVAAGPGTGPGGGHGSLLLVLQQGPETLKATVKLTDVVRVGVEQ